MVGSDEMRSRVASIEDKIDHMSDRVDHVYALLVGDGSERPITEQMRILWEAHEQRGRGLMWVIGAVITLLLERIVNYIRIGHI